MGWRKTPTFWVAGVHKIKIKVGLLLMFLSKLLHEVFFELSPALRDVALWLGAIALT